MTETSQHDLDLLSRPEAGLAAVFRRPKWVAAGCVVVLAALGWAYLGIQMALMPPDAAATGGLYDYLPRSIAALCQPSFGRAHAGMVDGVWSLADALLIWLMWCAMALAMMLPSAAPMIYTYAEIADTAARKREPIISPFVLAAGYVTVWLGFAIAATIAQWMLVHAALINPSMASTSTLFSGAIFIAAGAYQFTTLKHACLTQCQKPFPFFFTHWAATAPGVFRIGLQQGLYCLGCCWAMMLLMFVVGAMNVLWMAGLAMVMTIEKMTVTARFTRVLGFAMLATGMALVLKSVVERWPA